MSNIDYSETIPENYKILIYNDSNREVKHVPKSSIAVPIPSPVSESMTIDNNLAFDASTNTYKKGEPVWHRWHEGCTNTPECPMNTIEIGGMAGINAGTGSTNVGYTAGQSSSGENSTNVGMGAGQNTAGAYSTNVGKNAGRHTSGEGSTNVGYGAGNTNAGVRSTNLGDYAGTETSGRGSTNVGHWAGRNTASENSTNVGRSAGKETAGTGSTNVGYAAGEEFASLNSTNVGTWAGRTAAGVNSTSVGHQAGEDKAGQNSTNLGYRAGYTGAGAWSTNVGNQAGWKLAGSSTTNIGGSAGYNETGNWSTNIGNAAGFNMAGNYSTNVGVNTGQQFAGLNSTNVGRAAAFERSGDYSTNLGNEAGLSYAGTWSTNVGYGAAQYTSGVDSTNLGKNAGKQSAGTGSTNVGVSAGRDVAGLNSTNIGCYSGMIEPAANSTNVGCQAGQHNSGANSTNVGFFAGQTTAGAYSTNLGSHAGENTAGANSTNVGVSAGQYSAGANSVNIGYLACTNTSGNPALDNTIVLNASGLEVNPTTTNACFIKPVRNMDGDSTRRVYYNPDTSEVHWGSEPSPPCDIEYVTSLLYTWTGKVSDMAKDETSGDIYIVGDGLSNFQNITCDNIVKISKTGEITAILNNTGLGYINICCIHSNGTVFLSDSYAIYNNHSGSFSYIGEGSLLKNLNGDVYCKSGSLTVTKYNVTLNTFEEFYTVNGADQYAGLRDYTFMNNEWYMFVPGYFPSDDGYSSKNGAIINTKNEVFPLPRGVYWECMAVYKNQLYVLSQYQLFKIGDFANVNSVEYIDVSAVWGGEGNGRNLIPCGEYLFFYDSGRPELFSYNGSEVRILRRDNDWAPKYKCVDGQLVKITSEYDPPNYVYICDNETGQLRPIGESTKVSISTSITICESPTAYLSLPSPVENAGCFSKSIIAPCSVNGSTVTVEGVFKECDLMDKVQVNRHTPLYCTWDHNVKAWIIKSSPVKMLGMVETRNPSNQYAIVYDPNKDEMTYTPHADYFPFEELYAPWGDEPIPILSPYGISWLRDGPFILPKGTSTGQYKLLFGWSGTTTIQCPSGVWQFGQGGVNEFVVHQNELVHLVFDNRDGYESWYKLDTVNVFPQQTLMAKQFTVSEPLARTHDIAKLNPVNFWSKQRNKTVMGLLDEEVRTVFPEVVDTSTETGEVTKIYYELLTLPLISMVKEQQQTLEKQQRDIDELKQRLV